MPDKKWVFDTVTLSNFLLTESIHIIAKRYGQRAVITSQVLDELSAGFDKYPALKTIDNLIEEKVISICNISRKERRAYIELSGQLGKGEASSIAAAYEQGLVVVTDDRAARRVCSQMGVAVTGTIGIIKASLFDGEITLNQANDILKKMTASGFYSPVRKIDDLK
jgi:predicted nucleic acid-binding protein